MRPGVADPTAGLPYQATLGSGKRAGHEDRYMPQVRLLGDNRRIGRAPRVVIL